MAGIMLMSNYNVNLVAQIGMMTSYDTNLNIKNGVGPVFHLIIKIIIFIIYKAHYPICS